MSSRTKIVGIAKDYFEKHDLKEIAEEIRRWVEAGIIAKNAVVAIIGMSYASSWTEGLKVLEETATAAQKELRRIGTVESVLSKSL